MNWNQIFCKHIWKEIKKEILRQESHYFNAGASVDIDCYDVYAITKECIKCSKKEIIENYWLIKE